MDSRFGRFFRKKIEVVSSNDNSLYPGLSSASKRLLGLKEFVKISEEEERRILESRQRFNAYSNLDTTTSPRKHKIEYKKGIIREIVKDNLIDKEILKNNPTVYLGSGLDIEYPLSLGSSDIWLVDPVLGSEEAKKELKIKIEKLLEKELPWELQGSFDFNFDFGGREEKVKVNLISKNYKQGDIGLPQNIGLIIKFASQGPDGEIKIDTSLERNIVNGGYILDESRLEKIVDSQKQIKDLGIQN